MFCDIVIKFCDVRKMGKEIDPLLNIGKTPNFLNLSATSYGWGWVFCLNPVCREKNEAKLPLDMQGIG